MSDQTRQGIADAIAAHVADEYDDAALTGAWSLQAQVLDDRGDDAYIFEGDGSTFTRVGLATAYLTHCRTEAE